MFHIYIWPDGSWLTQDDKGYALTHKILSMGMYEVTLSSTEYLTPAEAELQVQIYLYG